MDCAMTLIPMDPAKKYTAEARRIRELIDQHEERIRHLTKQVYDLAHAAKCYDHAAAWVGESEDTVRAFVKDAEEAVKIVKDRDSLYE